MLRFLSAFTAHSKTIKLERQRTKPTMTSDLTKEQQIALAIIPKITSATSIGGLVYALCSFFRSWYKRGKLYHRLFLALTIIDLFRSINFFIGTWAIPESYPNIYMASGNEGTCTVQAVIFQLAQAVPIYLVSMSFYAYVAVKNDFKDLKICWIEKWIHLVALLVPLLLTICMVALNFQGIADGEFPNNTKLVRPEILTELSSKFLILL